MKYILIISCSLFCFQSQSMPVICTYIEPKSTDNDNRETLSVSVKPIAQSAEIAQKHQLFGQYTEVPVNNINDIITLFEAYRFSDDNIKELIIKLFKDGINTRVSVCLTISDIERLLKITEGIAVDKKLKLKHISLSNDPKIFIDFVKNSDNDEDKKFGLDLISKYLNDFPRISMIDCFPFTDKFERFTQNNQKLSDILMSISDLFAQDKRYEIDHSIGYYGSMILGQVSCLINSEIPKLDEICLNFMKNMNEHKKYDFLTVKNPDSNANYDYSTRQNIMIFNFHLRSRKLFDCYIELVVKNNYITPYSFNAIAKSLRIDFKFFFDSPRSLLIENYITSHNKLKEKKDIYNSIEEFKTLLASFISNEATNAQNGNDDE